MSSQPEYFQPASARRRLVSRLLSALIVAAEIAASILPIIDSGFASPADEPVPYGVAASILLFFCVANLVVAYRTGTLPGLRSLGVKAVLVDDGGQARGALVKKYVVEAFAGVLTLVVGLPVILRASSDDLGRTCFDRFAKIIYVDTRRPIDAGEADVEEQEAPAEPAFARDRTDSRGGRDEDRPVDRPWGAVDEPEGEVREEPEEEPSSAPMGPAFVGPGFSSVSAQRPGGAHAPQQPYSQQPPGQPYGYGAWGQEPYAPEAPFAGRQASPAVPAVRLVFDDGLTRELNGTLILGRNPVADPAHRGADLMPVADRQKSVSKTHAALTSTPHGLLVEDLQSTNGTVVISAEGNPVPVTPGFPVWAHDGSSVLFGGRRVKVTIR